MRNTLYSSKIVLGTIVGFCFFLDTALAQVPSSNQNYVIETLLKVPKKKTETQLAGLPVDSVNRTIQYFDGLGRPLQTVQWQASPSFRDLVTPVTYDVFGREDKKYLPYAATFALSIGSYKEAGLSEQQSFYSNPSAWSAPGVVSIPAGMANSKTVFEASPLNRVLEQGSAGGVWQPAASRNNSTGRTSVVAYGSNTGSDQVMLWEVLSGGAGMSGYYQVNKLYKTTSKDENWLSGKVGTIEEFKDFEERIILRRLWETETKSLSTYYVYDDLGNLRYVLPPAVNENGKSTISSFTESDAVFDQFIYAYHYDGRQRVVEKKIPGKGWEYMLYNKLDQIVGSQDALQRAKSPQEWIVTKYDAFGRSIGTGIYAHPSSSANIPYRETLQGVINSPSQSFLWEERADSGIGYTARTWPQSDVTAVLTLNYYDNYNFYGNRFGGPVGAGQVTGQRTKTLLTGTSVNVLGTGTMLLTVHYYDEKGQVLESKMENHLGGTDVLTNTWSFSGELTASTRVHTVGSTVTTIANKYSYDHVGRKTITKESINGQPEVILSKLEYNEVGQLLNKKLHSIDNGTSFLQSTNYAYNERGWLKNSSSAQFSQQLNYQDGTIPQFNGNISNQLWGAGLSLSNTFTYSYNPLNRLSNAVSAGLGEEITYDEMGNIQRLTREGFGTNNYTGYSGNKLTQISGFTNSNYSYDANGNLIADSQKNIILSYNYLNLPQQISGSQTITYTYDAAGNKLKKQSTAGVIDYVNGIQYKAAGLIDVIQTEVGLARNNNGSYSYEYTLSDHLGNNRTTFYRNPNTSQLEVLQRDDYFAFGLRKSTVVSANENKYLYNSKELQEELGQYDYGARFYDPVIGRWNVIDPKADEMRRHSPYNYAFNNPIRFIDPDGMKPGDPITEALQKSYNEAKKIFSGSASASAKVWGVGAGGKVGPLKLKGEINVLSGKGTVKNNGNLELTGTVANVKGEVGFGGAKASASGDLGKGSVEASLTSKGPVKGDVKLAEGSTEVSKGNVTFNNSLELGASGKIGPVEVEGNINFGHATSAVGHLMDAGTEYIKAAVNKIMKPQEYIPKPNQ